LWRCLYALRVLLSGNGLNSFDSAFISRRAIRQVPLPKVTAGLLHGAGRRADPGVPEAGDGLFPNSSPRMAAACRSRPPEMRVSMSASEKAAPRQGGLGFRYVPIRDTRRKNSEQKTSARTCKPTGIKNPAQWRGLEVNPD